MGMDSSPWTLHRPVRELIRRSPITCSDETPIEEAARVMQAFGVGSVVVVGPDGSPVGIVTDRDLRGRVLAARRSPQEPVRTIMSRPLRTVAPDDPAVDALVTMLQYGIHHVVVVRPLPGGGGQLVGVVSSTDFLLLQGGHPLLLLREIQQQERLEHLAGLAAQLDATVRQLADSGLTCGELARITTELYDALVRRVLELTQQELAEEVGMEPPVPFCWMALGSEGRREQILRTDQDNALVYADPQPQLAGQAQEYFAAFAQRALVHLRECGFPSCPLGVMAAKSRWRRPLGAWKGQVQTWVRDSMPEELWEAAAFFDLRPVWGETGLGLKLRQHALQLAVASAQFLAMMAALAAHSRPPLGLGGRILTPALGPGRGLLDVKRQGWLPLVAAVRVQALRAGVDATPTLERIRALSALPGALEPGEADELAAAFEILTRLRLRRHLKGPGVPEEALPDGAASERIAVASLGRAERAALREALGAVARLQWRLARRLVSDPAAGAVF